MTTYSDKLRDPRWQKKRLEILQRDEWCCQICFDSKSTLNVHHRYYVSGHEPWDYPTELLVTLCETCHQDEGEGQADVEGDLIKILRCAGAFNSDLNELARGFLNANFKRLSKA